MKSSSGILVFVIVAVILASHAFGADTAVEASGAPYGLGLGAVYNGYVVNGLASGEGAMAFSDGSIYYGGFQEGRFHGRGVFIAADGITIEGIFENGQLEQQREYRFGKVLYETD
ncbi:hypothetical protein FACS1894184_06310 [Clostridia bacterium]|nr:hypothetical protein FACS1894184_06310 [Clostridia bacterium]